MQRSTLFSGLRRAGRSRAITVTAAALAGLALPVIGTGAASAAPSHWETYHDEWFAEVSFCSGPALTISEQGFADGRFRTTTRGSDGLSYDVDRASFTNVWTNVATGEYATQVGSYQGGTHQVTDNSDGTLSVVIQYTRNLVIYNQDGQRISQDTGLFAFELLFDHAGTPADPSDDVLLEQVGTDRNTGLTADLCEVLVEAIG